MIKLKNILLMVITTIFTLCIMCGFSVSADSYLGDIFDDCNVLTAEEIIDLTEHLQNCADEVQINVAVLISEDTDRNGARDFTDVFAEDIYGKNSNTIVYLINLNDNYDYISCSGIAEDYYSDSTIDYILDNTSTYLTSSNMDFSGAISTFGDLIVSCKYQNQSQVGKNPMVIIAMGFVVSLIISLITCGIIASSYKKHIQISVQNYANSQGAINFTKREDRFLRTHTTKTPKESNNGGSSSGHVSSGGGHHTGGGHQR